MSMSKPIATAVLVSLLSFLVSIPAFAVPAKRGVFTIQQSDGTDIDVRIVGDENSFYYTTPDGTPLESVDGVFRPASANKPLPVRRMAPRRAEGLFPDSDFPCTGEQKVLVILVEYTDVKFLSDYNPSDYFTRLLNEEGFSGNDATGSARDYFIDNSKGVFTPQFDVYGPVTLPHPQSYYGGNSPIMPDVHGYEMVIDACAILDDEVDFSQYDRNGDGLIDNVFIYYAGKGEASGGGEDCVWPHSAVLRSMRPNEPAIIHDGVELNRYACSNERQANVPDGIGTFVHEFSHVLGLPDLYATSANQGVNDSFTPGSWSVMDYGPYNNNSHTPPYFSSFELAALGWLDPVVIDGATSVRLEDISKGQAYKIQNPARPNEYFLIENRQRHDWDSYIPGHGMLVWHIDYEPAAWTGNVVNNTPSHQYVDLIEADNRPTADTRDGDSFPGTAQVRSFTDDTKPSMTFWSGRGAGLPITEITERDGVISFKVGAGREAPAPVNAISAADVTSYSFQARWEASADATAYLLTVMHEGQPLAGLYRLNVGNVRAYNVSDMMPDSEYSYYVNVVTDYGESEASNVIAVTTAAPPFCERSPQALDATDVTSTGFTANWQALDEATGYLLNVYTKLAGGPYTETYDFAGYPDNFPAGWKSSTSSTYSMSSMAGVSIPSLRFNDNGDYISFGGYSDGIKELTFWTRASSEAEGVIELSTIDADGKKQLIKEIPVSSQAGGVSVTVNGLSDEALVIGAEILFKRTSARGNLAIDDVVLKHGSMMERQPLQGYKDKVVEGTSAAVTGLESGKSYFYNVIAINEGGQTKESNEIEVNSEISGLETPAVADILTVDDRVISFNTPGIAYIFDLAGHQVSHTVAPSAVTVPAPGFYVVKFEDRVFKIFIK